MRKIILLMHVSLDGFTAGPNGELDWIKFDEELIDYVGKLTDRCDTALFGRATYEMMEAYWPTAAEQPNASKHDIEHAKWVNNATKIMFSKTVKETAWNNSVIISDKIFEEIETFKKQSGKDMIMIGSPGIAQTFMNLRLIDEFRININPVILGSGISLYKDIKNKKNLKLIEAKVFESGVIGTHYEPFSE